MVMMVTSHARSLHDPTQQDFINAHPTHIYVSTCNLNSEEPSRVHYAI